MIDCTVKTRYGTFNGFVDKNGVKTWLGIPYAQPPVGKLRWQAPQKLNPTDKSFDAKKFGFTAMQTVDDKEGASKNTQSEDCLTLNIWTSGAKKIFLSWYLFTAADWSAAALQTRFITEVILRRHMMLLSSQ